MLFRYMTITIYIEYFFVMNYFMSYIVIYLTKILLQTGDIRIKTGAFISAFLYCLIIVIGGTGNVASAISAVLGPIFVASVIIPPFKVKKLSMKLVVLYATTLFLGVVMGGIISYTYLGYLVISLVRQNSGIIALGIWLAYGFAVFKTLIGCLRHGVVKIMNNLKTCHIILRYKGKVIKAKGLIDSGNSLYYGKEKHPVSIIEFEIIKEILNEKPRGLFTVGYKSLGQDEGVLYGIVFDEMEIMLADSKISLNNPYIGIYKGKLSVNGDYNMIVHKDYINKI